MTEQRLDDYLAHIREAAQDALVFVEGLQIEEFLEDKRTQQAVIMSLVILGEASTKVMDKYPVCCGTSKRSLAQHENHAQPNCSWVF